MNMQAKTQEQIRIYYRNGINRIYIICDKWSPEKSGFVICDKWSPEKSGFVVWDNTCGHGFHYLSAAINFIAEKFPDYELESIETNMITNHKFTPPPRNE